MRQTHSKQCCRRCLNHLTQKFGVSVIILYGYPYLHSLIEQSRHYVSRQEIKKTIHTTIKNTIRDSPPVLINTASGRLCNESEQAATFEMTPAFTTLISSMTTYIDHTSIEEEVGEFYRYATFSHRWEKDEPLFDKVVKIVVYDLEASPTHEKLQTFCRIVQKMGFNWAWSDTCCINKENNVVLQEALVSMFKWYEGSAMTIIFLRGVDRLALRDALTKSTWNMRAWTLQEYHASKVVQFYTEDWTPYLGLTIYNHKESPEIVLEMEAATGISAQALMALRPGLDDIREKLRLASTRQTTRVEDAAYSLLGILSLSLPVVYGEGDKALGRLLAQLLASSGDMSILAWTGRPNSFNSCLPASITVFRHPPTTHIPPAIPDVELGTMTTGSRSPNLVLATRLYDLVNGLPVPSFSGRRMKLPCITFKLGQITVSQSRSGRVFRSKTNGLGIVEIQTLEDLSRLDSLYLIHPWIDFLLDRHPVGSGTETIFEDDRSFSLHESPSLSIPSALTTRPTPTTWLMSRLGRRGRSAPDAASLRSPSTMSPEEKQMRVLQFMARLRRPFGALLFTPTRRNMDECRRVAAESLITVCVEEMTPVILDKLIQGVRVLDVL